MPVASVDDMAKRGVIGVRIKLLRDTLDWAQPKLIENAAARGHKLERPEISKVEGGQNLLSSARLRDAMAAGFLLTRTEFDAYLADRMKIDAVVALASQRSAPVPLPASHSGAAGIDASAVRTGDEMGVMLALKAIRDQSTTYPKLTLAVAYWADNGKSWSRPTIAAAEAGYFAQQKCEEWSSGQWAKALDQLEVIMCQERPPAVTKQP